MTKAELIDYLGTADDDMPVCIDTGDGVLRPLVDIAEDGETLILCCFEADRLNEDSGR